MKSGRRRGVELALLRALHGVPRGRHLGGAQPGRSVHRGVWMQQEAEAQVVTFLQEAIFCRLHPDPSSPLQADKPVPFRPSPEEQSMKRWSQLPRLRAGGAMRLWTGKGRHLPTHWPVVSQPVFLPSFKSLYREPCHSSCRRKEGFPREELNNPTKTIPNN